MKIDDSMVNETFRDTVRVLFVLAKLALGSIFSCIKNGGGIKVEKIKQNAFVKKVGFNRIILVGVLLLMYLLFGALTGGEFFGMTRILNTFNYAYFLGFLSLGVTFVIATGGIDFSIGPVMFCCALVSGYCLTTYGLPMVPALIMAILIGTLFGTWNGY